MGDRRRLRVDPTEGWTLKSIQYESLVLESEGGGTDKGSGEYVLLQRGSELRSAM